MSNPTREQDNAEIALAALHGAGWRLIRTEPVRPMLVERDWRITEEWSPAADPAGETT